MTRPGLVKAIPLMNTSAEAVKTLEQASAQARAAISIIEDLIAPNDYQDVAALVAHAGNALLMASALLLQGQDVDALGHIEKADDFLDEAYSIIEEDLGDAE